MSIHKRHDRLAPFRNEILDEALAICLGRPFGDLRRPRIAHLRGVLSMQQGFPDLAIAYFMQAIRLDPSTPAPYNDLGDALLRTGRGDEAIGAHLRAINLASRDAECFVRLGGSLFQLGLHSEARCAYEEALRLSPTAPDVHVGFGDVLLAQGHYSEALELYKRALRLAPDDADGHHRVGRAQLSLAQWREAADTFRRGLELQHGRAELHGGLGEALLRLGSLAEAERAFYTALTINPRDVNANRQFVLATELLGRAADAVGAWVNLGVALEAQRRPREAATAYRQALARKADCLRALFGLARVHVAIGDPSEALRCLDVATAVDPEHQVAHTNLGLTLQQTGEFERSWAELSWHHHPTNPHWRHADQPTWDGSPLDGRRILLWTDEEQNDVDTLLFLRYAQFAQQLGGRVMIECDRALVPLVRDMPGLDEVVASGGPLLPYDVHAPLLYFPAVIGTARSFVAASPYLRAPAHTRSAWRERIGPRDRLSVGIAWAGIASDRGSPASVGALSAFSPLASVPGIRMLNLQQGPHAHERLAPPPGLDVASYIDDSHSIADIAGAIVNLDLVVTVDTRIAHLAGALGTPVWTILSHAVAWPWPIAGETTPWYPTMRLFRQTHAGQWASALERVRQALMEWTAQRHLAGRASTSVMSE